MSAHHSLSLSRSLWVIGLLTAWILGCRGLAIAQSTDAGDGARRPNVIYILADDLGYGEVGAYGQTKIRTPNLDSLAQQGMRFTQHYSGSPVCAPSRCVLLTGKHTGHSYVRANYEVGGWGPDEPEGQLPLPEGTITLGTILQQHGYRTAAIGKWGLGGPGSTGRPNAQGFDLFYGYLCQRVAHNYYPTHLWRNDEKDILEGNAYFKAHQRIDQAPDDEAAWGKYATTHFAPDRMINEALAFVRESADANTPFLLYYATPVPHAAIQVPEDSLAEYLGEGWDAKPYLGHKGYLPHPAPRAGYAAMVTRMDRDIGRIIALLEELGLRDDTIILFSSDNGPTFNGGTDSTFFDSTAGLRGLKTQVYEGGIRAPFIANWPERIEAGSTSDEPSAFQDMVPTICELVGIEMPDDFVTDGVSLAPTLLGHTNEQVSHEYLYWEYRGNQVIRRGDWKAIWKRRKNDAFELYNLADDPFEQTDVAARYPDLCSELKVLMQQARTPSEHFPLVKK